MKQYDMDSSVRLTRSGRPSRSTSRQIDYDEEMARHLAAENSPAADIKPGRIVQPVSRRIPSMNTSRTFGSKSPIADLGSQKIQQFLAKCMASEQWNRYSEEEKMDIMQKLPPRRRMVDMGDDSGEVNAKGQANEQHTTLTAPLTPAFCMEDSYLKSAVARFKRDLQAGYYEKTWKNKAVKAHDERMAGDFDDYLKNCEEDAVNDNEQFEDGVDELAAVSEDEEYDPKKSLKQNVKSARH